MNTKSNSEALPPTAGSLSSETPLTDMMVAEIPSPPWTMHVDGLAKVCRAFEKKNRELESEVARWKKNIIPFLAVHAGNYGRDHYGEGCMHFTHYDMLAEAGGRMDDFKRCGAPSPENAEVEGQPSRVSDHP